MAYSVVGKDSIALALLITNLSAELGRVNRTMLSLVLSAFKMIRSSARIAA